MEFKHNLPSLQELISARRGLHPATRKQGKLKLSRLEKFALSVTRAVGTMGFFFILTTWTIGWLMWNLYAPAEMRFDPAPAFVIWLFMSNIIQLILLPLVMVGQNLEAKFADQRAEEDFEINKKAEREIEVIIAHLENQNEMMLEVMRKMEKM